MLGGLLGAVGFGLDPELPFDPLPELPNPDPELPNPDPELPKPDPELLPNPDPELLPKLVPKLLFGFVPFWPSTPAPVLPPRPPWSACGL